MMIPAFLLKQSVTVAPFQGNGAHGEVYGATFVQKGRFEFESKVMRDQSGAQKMSSAVLYVRPNSTIKQLDKVQYGGQWYEVLQMKPCMSMSSLSHIEFRLGSTEFGGV